MAELEIFNNIEGNEFQVRYKKIGNNDFLFHAADLARCLGYVDTRKAIQIHVTPEFKVFEGRRNASPLYLKEAGLYELIFGSKMEIAKKFRYWIVKDVMPSLRKFGKYELNNFEKFKQITDEVTRDSENFKDIKKICMETNEKLRDPFKRNQGRKGELKTQQKIRKLKKDFKETKESLKQTEIDLEMFRIKAADAEVALHFV